ncbi:MAG: hypothetical protein OEZ36_10710 [Spirochaetota bacterium]|nr:hypothetical protein [Spirochaetota bacterium]
MNKTHLLKVILLSALALFLSLDLLFHLIYPGHSLLRDDHRLVIDLIGASVLALGLLSFKYHSFGRRLVFYFLPGSMLILAIFGYWKNIPFHHLAKNCLIVPVDRLIALIKPDKLMLTKVHDRHGDFRYKMLWYRDFHSDMALGVNQGDFKDSNFGSRFHDANIGPEEFSCFPDDVVYARVNGKIEMSYAGYLLWNNKTYLSSDEKNAHSVYTRKRDMGMLTKYIEPFILKGMSDINADITVSHTMFKSKKHIKTDITIKNTYPQTADFYWVYQDNPLIYLPDPGTTRLKTISSSGDKDYQLIKGSKTSWIGMMDMTHGIGTFVYSADSLSLFVLPELVGVKGFPIKECENMGFPKCHLKGNDRYVLTDRELLPPELISKMNYSKRKPGRLMPGLVLQFGSLKPGVTKKLSFYRIGLSRITSPSEMKAELRRIIKQINN